MDSKPRTKTVVIGAGPVGSLAAIHAAQRGDDVEIYELRSDLRDPTTTPLNFTKSINLALSERGIHSIGHARCPGLLDGVLKETLPMHGRMIHARNANGDIVETSQQYDVHGRYIRAVDRAGLNKRLLDQLDILPNVKFFFNHKLTGADFNKNVAWFERKGITESAGDKRAVEAEVTFDFMIGADGAHSAVRYHLMKYARVNYQQEYIDTLWCEFRIPPGPEEINGGFRLSPNHLHIWPGGRFMFIAIPSLDLSFTCTLFLPESYFSQLRASPTSLPDFFDQHFPGVVPDLIDPSALQSQFKDNPHLPLISIKCSPHHYGSSCVILGDAAHAMVPFYGQGMNAGLEDVRVLFDHLDQEDISNTNATLEERRASALEQYTALRTPDAHAINDLALQNYVEMRASVKSPIYLARKWIEERVDAWFPALGWSTQYSRISFGNERYTNVQKAVRHQSQVLGMAIGVFSLGAVLILGRIAQKLDKSRFRA
ncbi:MAG: kynurenine 3-monooxygenase, mitochondrial precursor [Piccolia ochrophora]|nr:MAG: kynurenine 3-monooxygenase, mitochondrial precursor [Piccolia ochrophora]